MRIRTASILMGGMLLAGGASAGDYETEVEAWRAKRATSLQAEGGWLSVAGLFWLDEGMNRIGTDPSSRIVLPAGAPRSAGTIDFRGGKATLTLSLGVQGRLGKAVVIGPTQMLPDTEGGEVLSLGQITLQIIRRSERTGVRLRDPNSTYRKAFRGLSWYPVSAQWRIAARFTPYAPPRPLRIASVIGTTETMTSPGYATFSVGGREVRLDGVLEAPDSTSLFFIFRDETSGKQTYGGGRFLYADLPKEGVVVLDFNKAYNPPCAFTPYATCPVPPQQNRLPVAIEAGEKTYQGPGH